MAFSKIKILKHVCLQISSFTYLLFIMNVKLRLIFIVRLYTPGIELLFAFVFKFLFKNNFLIFFLTISVCFAA